MIEGSNVDFKREFVEDIRLAVEGRIPVQHFGRLGGIIPDPDEVVDALKRLF